MPMHLVNALLSRSSKQAALDRLANVPAVLRAASIRSFGCALALAFVVSVGHPLTGLGFAAAPAAHAKKRVKKPKSAAARKRAADRALKRARARVIPSRARPAPPAEPRPPIASKAPDPAHDGQPLTLAEKKSAVLNAPPEILKRIGRHIIVGYHTASQLTPLLERGAIGGVFVTARNARRHNRQALAKELTAFRDMATAAGQTTFWISTDQEGGSVSRLSPPLPYQPSLRNLLRKTKPEARDEAVRAYAARQASALSDLGINLNFAPVADINHHVAAPRDRHTRIRYRAISTDPAIVTAVVRSYCEELNKAGIYCTLKHFPGLGRIAADTHVTSAHLKTATAELQKSDWIPFREVVATNPAFIMVGHPHLEDIDPARPASTSPDVVQKLLRDTWKFDGVIVTDDLAMGAIRQRYDGGMARAARDAVNAGVDLVLIGSDNDDVYEILYGMILAHEKGTLSPQQLSASDRRLEQVMRQLAQLKVPPVVPPLPVAKGEAMKQAVSKTETARQ